VGDRGGPRKFTYQIGFGAYNTAETHCLGRSPEKVVIFFHIKITSAFKLFDFVALHATVKHDRIIQKQGAF
jgi:hypothetical protein